MPSTDSTKLELAAFRIDALPPHFYYIPDFISTEEEASILSKVSIITQHHPRDVGSHRAPLCSFNMS